MEWAITLLILFILFGGFSSGSGTGSSGGGGDCDDDDDLHCFDQCSFNDDNDFDCDDD
jgi:hypothetical protein